MIKSIRDMLLINEIKLPLNEDEGKLKEIIEHKLKCRIRSFEIHKKSLDARKDPHFVYSVIVDVDHENRYLSKNVIRYKKEDLSPVHKKRDKICAVIGYGPSGIFSAYRLMEAGFKVIVFEKAKGSKIENRMSKDFSAKVYLIHRQMFSLSKGERGLFPMPSSLPGSRINILNTSLIF